jgi:hypothetical protein
VGVPVRFVLFFRGGKGEHGKGKYKKKKKEKKE